MFELKRLPLPALAALERNSNPSDVSWGRSFDPPANLPSCASSNTNNKAESSNSPLEALGPKRIIKSSHGIIKPINT